MNLWHRFNQLNLPNQLTLLRIFAVPFFMASLLWETVWGNLGALLIFVAAALTDYWDGKLARAHNLITNFGRIMDPLADKLLLAAAFICFVQLDFAPAWMVILIIGRDFAITGLRVLAAAQGRIIAASTSGKHKTISQIVAVIVILCVNVLVSSLSRWAPPWEKALASLGFFGDAVLTIVYYGPYASMFVAAILSLYSGLEYLAKNRELFGDTQ